MLTSQYAYHTHQGLAYLFGSATERGGGGCADKKIHILRGSVVAESDVVVQATYHTFIRS